MVNKLPVPTQQILNIMFFGQKLLFNKKNYPDPDIQSFKFEYFPSHLIHLRR